MSDNIVHISVDTETLGLKEDCVVLSIGATAFTLAPNQKNDYDSYITNGFHVKFSVKDQITNWKRSVDKSTIDWWKKQEPAAQKIFQPSDQDVTMEEGLQLFSDWIKSTGYKWGKSYTWTRGLAFDIPKLESMYSQSGIKLPFNSWKARDTRTYIDILTGVDNGQYEPQNGFPKNFLKHDALHDASMDAFRMVEIFNALT